MFLLFLCRPFTWGHSDAVQPTSGSLQALPRTPSTGSPATAGPSGSRATDLTHHSQGTWGRLWRDTQAYDSLG